MPAKTASNRDIVKIARITNVNNIQDLEREKGKKDHEKSANVAIIAKVTSAFLAS